MEQRQITWSGRDGWMGRDESTYEWLNESMNEWSNKMNEEKKKWNE